MIRQSVLLLALVLCGVSAIQPGCRTRFEMRTRWTVQGVANRYWECSRWGKAVQKSCPNGTLFEQPFQTCVPYKVWEEFPYYPPPTTVDDWENECVEDVQECVDSCVDVPCEGGVVVDGKCERCIGGQLFNGQCFCFDNNTIPVDGVCRNGGDNEDCEPNGYWNENEGRCVCLLGYELVDGICTAGPAVENCVNTLGTWNAEQGVCVCPEGSKLVSGRCTNNPWILECDETGGKWDWEAGVCECPEEYLLVNYGCTNDREIIGCVETGGEWDSESKVCKCGTGTTLLNKWCVSTTGICDGAPESAYERGTVDCNAPACTEKQYWANIHWPTKNPRSFWQCPGINWVVEMPCAPGTCFSYQKSVCVHPRDWVNVCM